MCPATDMLITMDRTKNFQEILEKIQTEPNNALTNDDGKQRCDKIPSNIATSGRQESKTFAIKLKELSSSVTYMRDYLISNKKDYLNLYNSILSLASPMTEEERNKIDQDVEDFIKLCNDVIKILRVEIKSKTSRQVLEHETVAINLVESYVKRVYEFYNKQKALRLRRNLDSQKFFRLSTTLKDSDENNDEKNDFDDHKSSQSSKNSDKHIKSLNQTQKSGLKSRMNFNDLKQDQTRIVKTETPKPTSVIFEEENFQPENFNLSNEELRVFKMEGSRIYDEMNSMNEEVKTIGKKLSEISKLQDLFNDNVMKQELDLDRLNTSTIMSTETIREGNEQLREAMRKNAGFRVWILFFITVLAFVILFLDWYND